MKEFVRLYATGASLPSADVLPTQYDKESAYYMLAQRIDEEFVPGEPVNNETIYQHITRHMGLTRGETNYVLSEAIKRGYITKGKIKF